MISKFFPRAERGADLDDGIFGPPSGMRANGVLEIDGTVVRRPAAAQVPEFAGYISRKAYLEASQDPGVQQLLREADERWGDHFRQRAGTPEPQGG